MVAVPAARWMSTRPRAACRSTAIWIAATRRTKWRSWSFSRPREPTCRSRLLDHLLAGVDEATFSNVFAVGLRELQELGTLDDTKAADLLYKLTTGLDRVSLIDVMRDLSDVRRKLFDPRDESSRIPDLVQRRDQLRERMEALAGEGRQWIELQSQLVALEEQTRELQHRTERMGRAGQGAGRGDPRAGTVVPARRPPANNWRRSASCGKFPTRRSNASRPCGN